MPTLPRYKELASALAPIHARLARENSMAKRHPVHKCSETQVLTVVCLVFMLSLTIRKFFRIPWADQWNLKEHLQRQFPSFRNYLDKLLSSNRPYNAFLMVKLLTNISTCLQAEAAGQFLKVMRGYLESLCLDLRLHTITSVQSNNDRVRKIELLIYHNHFSPTLS